jgi:hypothetical protein
MKKLDICARFRNYTTVCQFLKINENLKLEVSHETEIRNRKKKKIKKHPITTPNVNIHSLLYFTRVTFSSLCRSEVVQLVQQHLASVVSDGQIRPSWTEGQTLDAVEGRAVRGPVGEDAVAGHVHQLQLVFFLQ